MKSVQIPVLRLLILLCCAALAIADVPRELSYQGRLTDDVGTAVDTTADLTIVIFADEAGTTPLWQETHPDVTVVNGLFDVVLGSINPIPDTVFNGEVRWLGMQIESGPMSTVLVPILSAAYSIKSSHADTAGFAASSNWYLEDGVLRTSQQYGLSRGGDDSQVLGSFKNTMVNLGHHSTVGWDGMVENATISGGAYNYAREGASTISGGIYDTVTGSGSTIAGGARNTVSGNNSWMGGSFYSYLGGTYSAILGGHFDTIPAGVYGSYLFGLRSKLTTDSTFMVDLPYIRFGDEATGYLFPSIDGSAGEALVTDGGGQLSWQTVAGSGGGWVDDGPVVRLESGGDRVGIKTSTASEPLVVGHDLGSYEGDYIVVGNSDFEGFSGYMLGQSADNRATLQWYGDGTEAQFHIRSAGQNFNHVLAIGRGAVGVNTNSNTSYGALTVNGQGYFSDNVGIGTTVKNENLVVGKDLGGFSGNRMVVGDNTAGVQTGLVMGEDNNNRGWFLWDVDGDYVSMGLRDGGTSYNNSIVLKGGNVGLGTSPIENHRLFTQSNGYRVAGATSFFKNTNDSGIAVLAENTSIDATCVFVQYGSGDILRCFSSDGGPWNMAFAVTHAGRAICNELQLLGGADLAEPFAMSQGKVPAGALVVIDDKHAGKLKLSNGAYDTRVAGIVSGAGGVKPGLTLSQKSVLDEGQNVAINGRVYCLADAGYGAIRPGDMLTTSDTPGHAMRATDRERSYGAVIGKAMSGLDDGTGLVLVLVSLQ